MKWQPPRMARNLDDPITGFQVLGERSSGTNFVTQLLLRNLDGAARTPVYGWKHGFVDRRVAPTAGLLTVLVYRHPLRWLQSLHARPLDLSRAMQGLSFSGFIRHEWQGAFRKDGGEEASTADMEPKAKVNYANALKLRSAKIGYFEELAAMPARVAFLRYEDVNRDPKATLAALAAGFDLRLKSYAPVQTFKGITTSPYVPKQLPRIDADDLAFIARELDLEQEARIGYSLEAVPRFDGLPGWDIRSVRSVARGLRRRISPRSGGISRPAKG